eukprot:5928258-Pyramimonas_sp.AAC.1
MVGPFAKIIARDGQFGPVSGPWALAERSGPKSAARQMGHRAPVELCYDLIPNHPVVLGPRFEETVPR